MRLFRFLCILAACLSAASPSFADQLQLRNGDRLTGTAVSLAGGTLTFSTAYGEVRIPWEEVAGLTVDDPILVTTGGETRLQQGGPIKADATALARPQPTLVLAGGVNIGFVTTAGNTRVNSLRLDGDLAARQGENRYTGAGLITRAEDQGVATARNWSATAKYDRFLSSRMFVNGNAIFTSDRFRDLELRIALGAGAGYQMLTGSRITLTADGGIGYVNENLENGNDSAYAALRESAALTIVLWPGRMEFFHQQDGYFGVHGDDNLFVKMQNGVRLGLPGGFVTTLRHDLDYDRSPSPGRRTTDRTFSLTLGCRF